MIKTAFVILAIIWPECQGYIAHSLPANSKPLPPGVFSLNEGNPLPPPNGELIPPPIVGNSRESRMPGPVNHKAVPPSGIFSLKNRRRSDSSDEIWFPSPTVLGLKDIRMLKPIDTQPKSKLSPLVTSLNEDPPLTLPPNVESASPSIEGSREDRMLGPANGQPRSPIIVNSNEYPPLTLPPNVKSASPLIDGPRNDDGSFNPNIQNGKRTDNFPPIASAQGWNKYPAPLGESPNCSKWKNGKSFFDDLSPACEGYRGFALCEKNVEKCFKEAGSSSLNAYNQIENDETLTLNESHRRIKRLLVKLPMSTQECFFHEVTKEMSCQKGLITKWKKMNIDRNLLRVLVQMKKVEDQLNESKKSKCEEIESIYEDLSPLNQKKLMRIFDS